MKKIFLAFAVYSVISGAGGFSGKIPEEWITERKFVHNGEKHLEKETLDFRADTFRLILNITISKGTLLVRDLRIEASGLWKMRDDILVIVMQELRFAGVGETRGINRESFRTVIRELRGNYLTDPIRLYRVLKLTDSSFVIHGEENVEKSYSRN